MFSCTKYLRPHPIMGFSAKTTMHACAEILRSLGTTVMYITFIFDEIFDFDA